jgi:hypothetical protein
MERLGLERRQLQGDEAAVGTCINPPQFQCRNDINVSSLVFSRQTRISAAFRSSQLIHSNHYWNVPEVIKGTTVMPGW